MKDTEGPRFLDRGTLRLRTSDRVHYSRKYEVKLLMTQRAAAPMDSDRLVIVSNRLPTTVSVGDDGSLRLDASSGGLATGLRTVHERTHGLWIGWPGQARVSARQANELRQLLDRDRLVPVEQARCLLERRFRVRSGTFTCGDVGNSARLTKALRNQFSQTRTVASEWGCARISGSYGSCPSSCHFSR
jgi:hypothetical protein